MVRYDDRQPIDPEAAPEAVLADNDDPYSPPNHGRPDVRWILVDYITSSPRNPRQALDEPALEELARSIAEQGLIQPITLRRITPEAKQRVEGLIPQPVWEIVAGERRWRAAIEAGLREVPAMIRADLSNADHLRIALAENLKRKDLNPIEEATGYRRLQDELGLTQAEIAGEVEKKQPTIANALRLLELPSEVQHLIASGRLTKAHGIALAAWKRFPDLVRALAALAVTHHLPSAPLETDVLLERFAAELGDAGLLCSLRGAPFAPSACDPCPLGARRGSFCLIPAHFAELAARADQIDLRDGSSAEDPPFPVDAPPAAASSSQVPAGHAAEAIAAGRVDRVDDRTAAEPVYRRREALAVGAFPPAGGLLAGPANPTQLPESAAEHPLGPASPPARRVVPAGESTVDETAPGTPLVIPASAPEAGAAPSAVAVPRFGAGAPSATSGPTSATSGASPRTIGATASSRFRLPDRYFTRSSPPEDRLAAVITTVDHADSIADHDMAVVAGWVLHRLGPSTGIVKAALTRHVPRSTTLDGALDDNQALLNLTHQPAITSFRVALEAILRDAIALDRPR